MSERRTVIFKAAYWYYENIKSDNNAVIHIGGKTQDNKSVHVIVENFEPTVYLQLPKRIAWDKTKCKKMFEWMKETMKDGGPTKYDLVQRYILHYKQLVYCMKLDFRTEFAAKKLQTRVSNQKGFYVPSLGTFKADEFRVHEHNIDSVIKFTAKKLVILSSWVKVTEMIREGEEDLSVEDRKYSSADIDMYANWSNVTSANVESGNTHVPPKYASFDIECYSENHNSKIPDATIPTNVVNQIVLTVGVLGEAKETRKRILLTLGDPKYVENCDEIKRHGYNEKGLLLDFKEQVLKHNPDIYLGYNITKFDWDYLITRAEMCGIYNEFCVLGRIFGKPAELRKIKWGSSAYGEQEFRYLECHGRTNVDLLVEIERNFRLPNYTLNTVSNHFNLGSKDDLSARHLFMIWKMTRDVLPKVKRIVKKGYMTLGYASTIKSEIGRIFSIRQCRGLILKYRKKLMKCNTNELYDTIREGMSLMGKYCVQDTVLVIDLAEKLNTWTTMEEMSNVTNVPLSYLHTRGQQIKVAAQVYRETSKKGMIIPFFKRVEEKEKFQGAMVVEANPGEYNLVATEDFASLYPSLMMAYNICPTTILDDKDPTPDSECHVIAFSDHIGCIATGTSVSLSNMSYLIQDLEKNHEPVYGIKEGSNGIDLFSQKKFFEQGIKKCVSLTFEDGTVLTCTPDHRVYTSNGVWVEANDLEYGQCVKMTYRPPVFDVDPSYKFKFADEIFSGSRLIKLMQLFGILMSDSYVSKGRCKIYLGHKLDCRNMESDLFDLFNIKAIPKKQNYGWAYLIPGKYGIAFRNLPGVKLGGKINQVRSLPEFLLDPEFPEPCVGAFLSGLFGGDGHTLSYSAKAHSLGSVAFSWSSDNLDNLTSIFNDISTLLRRFDISSTITTYGREMKLNIPISDTLKFHEKINFAHCVHKAARLEAGCIYYRHRNSVWNQQKEITEEGKMLRSADKITKGRLDRAVATIKEINKYRPVFNEYYANPTKQQLTNLMKATRKQEKPMFSKDHFFGPMEYMEKIGASGLFSSNRQVIYGVHEDSNELPTFNVPLIFRQNAGKLMTYDLEIDQSHTFIANGIIVHNCEHDPQKRKKKKADIMCRDNRNRFLKVKYVIDKNGKVTRENEGVFPRLERTMMLTRKLYKKEMAKAEAKVKMNSGKAGADDIAYYKKIGYTIIEKGSLSEHEARMADIDFVVWNAKQLAVKISMNSMYGSLGVCNGMIPLIKGAASVTAMGRLLITMAIAHIRAKYPFAKLVYGDSVSKDTPILCRLNANIFYRTIDDLPISDEFINVDGKEYAIPVDGLEVWSDKGFTPIKKIIRHKTTKKMYRILTHTGVVDVTEDHSLLNDKVQKVKPSEVGIGSKLLHHDLPHIVDDIIEDEVAYAMGLFYGDGSCGSYDCPSGKKNLWAINNTNLDFLNKAKIQLDKYYKGQNSFKILDTMESSHVYKLEAQGNVKMLVKEWRELFYDKEKYKKVPDIVFKYTSKSKEDFYEGYYDADGDKDKLGYLRFDNKGKIGSAGLYLLASLMGYPVSINMRSDKPNIYRMTLTRPNKAGKFPKQRKDPTVIKKIVELPQTDDYVYDLETDNHHFAAGVGRMIVHNTDSCMIHFEGKNVEEHFKLGEEASRSVTHHLKCHIAGVPDNYTVGKDKKPIADVKSVDTTYFLTLTYDEQCHVLDYETSPIDLEFENLYGWFLLLTKKRYMAEKLNKKGEFVGETLKGNVLTRRDNSKYLRDTYRLMKDKNTKEDECMRILCERIQMLFTRQIPDTDLIIYMGIKTLMNYAKSKKIPGKKEEKVFIDANKDVIDEPTGPLDPRLVYTNIPQVLLALKMTKRGEDIPPNTRLEFLYLKNDEAVHQGEKAEDYTYYKENQEGLEPDNMHYIEKQLSKPVTELMNVRFPKPIVPYIPMENKLLEFVGNLTDLQRYKVANIKTYNKPRPEVKKEKGIFIGWDVLREIGCKKKVIGVQNGTISLSKDLNFTEYKFKSEDAKIAYMLDQMKYETGKNDISSKSYPELLSFCTLWKSMCVIDFKYKQYGITRRKWVKPTYIGAGIRVGTAIILMQDCGKIPKGSICKIIDREDIGKGKNMSYFYDIVQKKTDVIEKKVARNVFTTFTMKDGNMMKNILAYRENYAEVVEQLNSMFDSAYAMSFYSTEESCC